MPILLYVAMWSCILGMASHQEKPTTVGDDKKDTKTREDMVLAIPASAAPRNNGQNGQTTEQTCRNQVGTEAPEDGGRSHQAQFQAHQLGDCMRDKK